ncbi:MAG: hypothetical protein KDI16_10710 [Halioglobus sp.]|nr:hypothetical protein [Halioglobus sp.]
MRDEATLIELARRHPANSPALQAEVVEYSEDALALDFATRYGGRLRYSPGLDWLHFNGSRWESDKRLHRYDYAREVCRSLAAGLPDKDARRITAASTVNAVVSLARSDQRLVVDAEVWDADERAMNTPRGIVDLMTGSLRPTLSTDYVTRITEVAPAESPPVNWLRFLESVFSGDVEIINFMQVLLGYCLTGSTREQKLFFFFGKGSNGKSTLLDLVEWILGDYSLKLPASVLMQSKLTSHPTELAQLQGRRLATSSEIEDGQYWAESRIKELTGDEVLSARFMRQDFFQFRQTQKHVICGNYRPRLKGGDSAMQRRMVLVPFDACFTGDQVDKSLPDKLRDEAPAILHWMVQGAVKWAAEGLTLPEKIRAASAEYMLVMDDLSEWVEDCCEVYPDARESNKYLFASFAEWKRQRAEKVPSVATWGERMRQQLRLEGYKSGGTRGFVGISLKNAEVERLNNRGLI